MVTFENENSVGRETVSANDDLYKFEKKIIGLVLFTSLGGKMNFFIDEFCVTENLSHLLYQIVSVTNPKQTLVSN